MGDKKKKSLKKSLKKERISINTFEDFVRSLTVLIERVESRRFYYYNLLKRILSEQFVEIRTLYNSGWEYNLLKRLFELGIIKRKRFIDKENNINKVVVIPSWNFYWLLKRIEEKYYNVVKNCKV